MSEDTPYIIAAIASLVFLSSGLVFLWQGWFGMKDFSEPRCARCKGDLRYSGGVAPQCCPNCGANLERFRAIRWGTYRKRPRRLAFGLLLVISPVLYFAVAIWDASRPVTPYGNISAGERSNKQLIETIKADIRAPDDSWWELGRRAGDGRLSQGEINEIVDCLITWIEQQGSATFLFSRIDQFLQHATPRIDPERWLRFARAHYGASGAIDLPPRIRSDGTAAFRLTYGPHENLNRYELVFALREVKSNDGRSLVAVSRDDDQAIHEYTKAPSLDDLSSSLNGIRAIEGELRVNLLPGEYELSFIVDARLLISGTVPRMVNGKPGQATHWPQGKARWTFQVKKAVTVVPAGQSPIEIIPDSPDLVPPTVISTCR